MNLSRLKRRWPFIIFISCPSLLLNAYMLTHFRPCLRSCLGLRRSVVLIGGNQIVDAVSGVKSHQQWHSGRMLATSSAAATSSGTSVASGSGNHGQHHSHSQDSLLYLFNAIIFGVILLQLTTVPGLHHMQQSVAIFVLGICYSLCQEVLKVTNEQAGALSRSYDMWMNIDPHLMLFTMLPALLAGDAMALDTNVVKRVAGQCMYLAGPGVLLNTMLAAGFLRLFLDSYDWQFELCLTAGAIMAATDPVAVVSLLKQLGAAPSLTILIQGESLLNDGTAIVCFVLAYDMLKGETYDFGRIIVFIVRKATCACGLGWVIGWVFVVWINAAGNRFEHHSGMLQVCLTLCCAYWSFIIAEGVLDMSGVLCTVSASLVMADNMWASIVDKEGLLHVWHVVEFLGNTLIFFLAGSIMGSCMVHIPALDYLHLLVIYIVLTIIRGSVIIGSLPILRKLGNATVPLPEALVMTWGGLRGAVGLALAIQVSIEKAEGQISDMNARRVLFYTGGLALLTLVINAVTCPALVKFLGLVQTDDVKKKLLMKLCSQMVRRVNLDELKPSVRAALEDMIERIDASLAAAYDVHMERGARSLFVSEGNDSANHARASNVIASSRRTITAGNGRISQFVTSTIRQHFMTQSDELNEGQLLLDAFDMVLAKLETIPESICELLNVPVTGDLRLSDGMRTTVISSQPDPQVMELINMALLSLIQAEYWNIIDEGGFIKGSSHPQVLLNSTAWAMQAKSARLADFEFICEELQFQKRSRPVALDRRNSLNSDVLEPERTRQSSIHMSVLLADADLELNGSSALQRLVSSTPFNCFITFMIVFNVLNVFIEEGNLRGTSVEDYVAWLAIEICFTVIFTLEFVLRFYVLGRQYFHDAWNCFDFLLVISGIFGVIVELIWKTEEVDVSSKARAFRVNRIFRALRLMRVFRLVQLLEVLRARWSGLEMSLHLAKNMRTITIMSAFARAHFKAEKGLINFFGNPLRFPGSEMARCIVDSRTAVCDAICASAFEVDNLEIVILERLAALRESGEIIEDLTNFILEATKMGTINAKEAENLLNPLREQQERWFAEGKHHMAGIYDRTQTALLAMASRFAHRRNSVDASHNPGMRRVSMSPHVAAIQNPFKAQSLGSMSVVDLTSPRSEGSEAAHESNPDSTRATPCARPPSGPREFLRDSFQCGDCAVSSESHLDSSKYPGSARLANAWVRPPSGPCEVLRSDNFPDEDFVVSVSSDPDSEKDPGSARAAIAWARHPSAPDEVSQGDSLPDQDLIFSAEADDDCESLTSSTLTVTVTVTALVD